MYASKMSKMMINESATCVDDFLEGLQAIHSGLIQLPGHRVILRRDLENLKGKVALLSGGGSGHEPAHAGYIGKGMLTGAICGAVFTSPPPSSIFAAIKAVQEFSPSGVLLIVKNYTGDRLNFGLAREWALNQNFKIDMIVVGDDCALTSADRSAGRRGLAGTVLVHKIAGALAENGKSLEVIVNILTDVCNNLGTIGVCIYPCILPGNKKATFQLDDSEIELGLGIHGEAGIKRIKMESCQQIVLEMVNHMTDPKSVTHISLEKKTDVVVLLNNLGGTSNLEMGIFANETLKCLRNRDINVVRAYCGSYMTSLQMAGVSLTILKLPLKASHDSAELISLLDMETNVPAPLIAIRQEKEAGLPEWLQLTDPFQSSLIEDQFTLTDDEANTLKKCIINSCHALKKQEALLNEYDTGAGDADCGTTHARGADAILKQFQHRQLTKLGETFQEIGTVCSRDMGGTSGAMYSIFMTAAARHLAKCKHLSVTNFTEALKQGLESMQYYGGAKTGDRTMLDVLDPILKQLLLDNGKSLGVITSSLIETAQKCVESTVGMKAKAGRASYVHSSLLINPDAGAQAVATIIIACAKSF